MQPTVVHARALTRAAEILGGTEALVSYLNVPKSDLRRWMQGEARLPDHVFLKVVDLLAESEMSQLRRGGGGA